MVELKTVLKQEVEKYAGSGRGARLRLYPILDDERQMYTVIALDEPRGAHLKSEIVVVFARLQNDFIIIEADNTDAPLLDALRQQDVPREQIVLAYAGESLPEETPVSGD